MGRISKILILLFGIIFSSCNFSSGIDLSEIVHENGSMIFRFKDDRGLLINTRKINLNLGSEPNLVTDGDVFLDDTFHTTKFKDSTEIRIPDFTKRIGAFSETLVYNVSFRFSSITYEIYFKLKEKSGLENTESFIIIKKFLSHR